MFVFGKILLWLSQPANVILALLIVGTAALWLPWRRAGRRILTAAVALMVLIAMLPFGTALTTVLENRFPPPTIEGRIDGIIVLGGAFNTLITESRGQVAVSEPVERLTEFAALARRFPEARLVFSGGTGSLRRPDLKEALVARRFFIELGLDPARVTYESDSRSTFENAVLSRALVRPSPGERWLLVTSASHMPRAVGCFRKVGWEVIAYPVDYHTTGDYRLAWFFDFGAGLAQLNGAAYEWFGLIGYWLLGRTSELFPGP